MKQPKLKSLETLRESERKLYFSEKKNSLKRILNLNLEEVTEQKGITLMALVITILFSYDEKLKCSNSKGFLLATI